MSLKVRTFEIREGEEAEEDEERVSTFLRAAAVERIETAFADRRWRLLILYNDQKDKEESAQIASVIAAALKQWRRSAAQRGSIQPGEVLSDEAVTTIAQCVPTLRLSCAWCWAGTPPRPSPIRPRLSRSSGRRSMR